MWPFISLVAALAVIVGLISVIFPLRFIGIRTRMRGSIVTAIGIVIFVVAAVNLPPPEAPSSATAATAPASPTAPVPVVAAVEPAKPVAPPLPASQTAFLNAVESGRAAYQSGSNDFQKGASRPARAKAICAVVPQKVEGWIGTITNLTTNGDGKGVIDILVGKDVTVATTNNSFSDTFSKSLIEPGTKLFASLGELSDGEKVRVSFSFIKGETDCYDERSLTLGGSMRDPVFTVRFSSIAKLQ